MTDDDDRPEPEAMPLEVARFVESVNRMAARHRAFAARRHDKTQRLPVRCRLGRDDRDG